MHVQKAKAAPYGKHILAACEQFARQSKAAEELKSSCRTARKDAAVFKRSRQTAFGDEGLLPHKKRKYNWLLCRLEVNHKSGMSPATEETDGKATFSGLCSQAPSFFVEEPTLANI